MEETKMEETKNEPVKKLSYEQLEAIASQVTMENKKLQMALNNSVNLFKRLDYLFKVVENDTVFPVSFVDKVVEEITNIMTIDTKEDTNETTEDTVIDEEED